MSAYIRVGVRPSQLSLKQVEEIHLLVPELKFKVAPIKTKGDKDKLTPLSLKENSDFFTFEIEQALLNKKIDIAIHSAKDLEENIPQDLIIACMTKSISKLDSLVSRENFTLETLPTGSIVGTSSRKRKLAIFNYRKDLSTLDIRGDINERLFQLDKGYFDAIIVAHAALLRLGYKNRVSQIISSDIIQPHPLQGRLAVQVRKDRKDLRKIFRRIHEK